MSKLVYFLLALAVVLLAFRPLPLFQPANSGSLADRGKHAEALEPVRRFRGRLTGRFSYAPHSGAGIPDVQGFGDLRKEVERSGSPRAQADLGLVQFLAGETEKAQATLTAAAAWGSKDASILSDLAAVLLDTLLPAEKVRALDVAYKAAEAAPELMEAQCNFALALDDFALVSQAREAWARCLDLDDGRGWRPEVEERLCFLERPTEAEAWQVAVPLVRNAALRKEARTIQGIANRFRQRARLYSEEVELPRWGAAVLEGRLVEADRHLQVVRALAEALQAIHGDVLLAETIGAIEEAIALSDGERLRNLAKGHAGYGRGWEHYLKREDVEAVAEFEQAAEAFRRARSPFRKWAMYRAQFCRFMSGTPGEDVLPIMEALAENLDVSRYPILEARRLTLMGMANVRRAHFAEAAHFYQGALRIFAELGEREHHGSLLYMLGDNLRQQGEIEKAWGHYLEALSLLRDVGPSVFFRNTLMEAADVSLRQGYPSTSLLFHKEMVRMAEARQKEDPLVISEALQRRSSAHRILGDLEAARRDLVDSRKHAERVSLGKWRDRLLANIDFAVGELELEVAPDRALAPLTDALDASLRSRMRYLLPRFYHVRAEAFLATGDLARARTDLEKGILEVEAQRRTMLTNPIGAALFEQAKGLFDTVIGLELRLKRPAVAFEYAERSRARSLLDMYDLGAGGTRVVGAAEIQRELPSRIALIEFLVLKDRTLVWILTRDSLQVLPLAAGEQRLESLVGELRSAVTSADNARGPAISLYRLLLQPLHHWLGERDLIVVPDGILHLLPFAALINPRTGRYLLEERAVAKAPSATLWVKALQRDRTLGQRALSGMLVVGDPWFDRELFKDLTSLPASKKEALEVAATRPGSRLLVNEFATKNVFLTEAHLNSVIHLATHARSNRENPLLAALLLSRDGQDPGVLYAHEIYQLNFTTTRLVVLSACGTSNGKMSSSEGVGSLARAFLAAGVPAVVGSLWDTRDKSAPDVLIAFHHRLSRGENPMSALRGAQLELLRRPNSGASLPYHWAGFELIGGVSPR